STGLDDLSLDLQDLLVAIAHTARELPRTGVTGKERIRSPKTVC
ncbi:MAG: hypothetical protein ACI9KE_005918, partial [Polyangiales bacterium]